MAYVCGMGTTVQIDISSTMTDIPQVVSVSPPSMEMGNVDVTHLTSAMRENKPTIIDPGEVSFELEYDPANTVHQQLWTSFQAGTVEDWQVTLTDAGTTIVAFSGHIQTFGINELTVDNAAVIPITIKVSGAVTITTS